MISLVFIASIQGIAPSDAGTDVASDIGLAPTSPSTLLKSFQLGRRTFVDALVSEGLDYDEAERFYLATRKDKKTRPQGLNFRNLSDRLWVTFRLSGNRLDWLELRRQYVTERPTVYRFERQDDTWAKREVAFASERKLARIQGRIEQGGTLSLAVDQLGEFPTLVNEFDRLFGWQMDFYRQQRVGDEFAMLVEKIYIDGVFREYGRVLSGLYQSKVHGPLLGFKMKQGPGFGVFDEKGRTMERAFLRNPMEITRITSNYGMRFHPVLGKKRKHNGVDYGAPTGTPVWSVAKGRVTYSGWAGASGKLVVIAHSNGYVTIYAHLSKIHVAKGQYVGQRQVIGRVGSTGRSTGPNLHFGMKKNGRYVDPLRQKFPKGAPLKSALRKPFLARVAKELPYLRGERSLPERPDWLSSETAP
ncbi:MAG: peptidoglycan DD-metalloendopeptidase family protein [Myxococcota bacterium]|nr:peptidoglycan DD-metalloendopeptidase family protein [Myxococcota bacterium]